MTNAKQIAKGLIDLLQMKGQLDLLPGVIEELDTYLHSSQQGVLIESAVALSDKDLTTILETIKDKLGFLPEVVQAVNPELLGGIKLKIGDHVFDVTLKNRLAQLKEHIH